MWMHRSFFDAIERNRGLLYGINGPGSPIRLIEENRNLFATLSGRGSPLRFIEDQRGMFDLVRRQTFSYKLIGDQRAILELPAGRSSVLKAVAENSKLLATLSMRSPFASMVNTSNAIAAITAQPYFSSLIGLEAMPLPAWAGVLDSLRAGIGEDLHSEAAADFDAAAELVTEGDHGSWWVARLPLTVQLALIFVVLQVLAKLTEFLQDLDGQDPPPAYRSGIQVVFALGAALLVVVEAKAKASPGDDGDGHES